MGVGDDVDSLLGAYVDPHCRDVSRGGIAT
jgi:hypothetical protein